MGGDPELEAAAKAERARQAQQNLGSDDEKENEEDDEDDWTPKDAAAAAKKEKQMAKHGIIFQSKLGASSSKVLIFPCFPSTTVKH